MTDSRFIHRAKALASCLALAWLIFMGRASAETVWRLTIPVSGTWNVPSGEIYTPVFEAATFADATAIVKYSEFTYTDNQSGGRNYDAEALFNVVPMIDRFTYACLVGAGQIGRDTGGYPDVMTFFARKNYETGVFELSTPGQATFELTARNPLNFGASQGLYVRCWFNRGDGHPGPAISDIRVITDVACATMPGARAIAAAMSSNTSITVNWRVSPADSASAQKVYRATAAGGPWFLVQSFANNTTSQYVDATAAANVAYYYKIVAEDSAATPGADSNVVSGIVIPVPNGPQVTALSPAPGSILSSPPVSIVATFNANIDPTSVTAANFVLVGRGSDGVFNTGDDLTIVPVGVSVNGNAATLDLTGVALANDQYRVALRSNGAALQFDGGNDGVFVPEANIFQLTSFSLEAWVKADGVAHNQQVIFRGDDRSANDPYSLGIAADGRAYLRIDTPSAGTFIIFSPSAFPTGSWTHLAGTYDAPTKTLTLFVNGVSTATASTTQDPIQGLTGPNPGVSFGNLHDLNQGFQGTLKEVRIWNGARSQAQVQASMGHSLQGNEAGLVGYWRMADGSGQYAKDATANGHDGVLGLSNSAGTDDPVWVSGSFPLSGVRDSNGNILDGETNAGFPSGDGTPGGDFTATFTVDLPPPTTVTALSVTPGSLLAEPPVSITATFSQNIDPASVNTDTFRLVGCGPDGVFDTADDVTITPLGISVNANQATLDLTAVSMPAGAYRIVLAGSSGRGTVLRFNGTSSFVSAPQWLSGVGNAVTFECWVQPRGAGDVMMHRAFFSDSTLDFYNTPRNYFTWDVRAGNPLDHIVNTQQVFATNKWYHVASTWDGSQQRIYLNGQLEASIPGPSTMNWDQNYFGSYIGGDGHDGWAGFLNGDIQEARIWNVARTQAQIQAAMHGLAVAPPGLRAYYKMREGTGQVVADSSGNGLDATLGSNLAVAGDDPAWVTALSPFGVPIRDLNGNALDGEPHANFPSGNGTPGGDFTATFTIVTSPIANDQSVTTPIGVPKAITLTAVAAGSPTWTIVAQPAHGVLIGTAPNVTFTPDASYTTSDSFTFKVNDGVHDSNVATVSIYVPTTVTALSIAPNSVLTAAPTSITATFSQNIDPASATAASFNLIARGPDGVFDTSDDVTIVPASVSVTGNLATLDLTGVSLVSDVYKILLRSGLGSAPSNGLINHWSFDEGVGTVAANSIGNGNNGTVHGAVWVPGKIGNALYFNGGNSYVDTGASDLAPPWTFGVWVKREASGNIDAYLISSLTSGNLKLEQYPNLGVVGMSIFNVEDHPYNYTAPIGQWVHLTFRGTSGATALYVNGAYQDSVALAMNLPRNIIGASHNNDFATKGTLDDLRIYNYALSDNEIQQLAQSGISDTNGNPLDGEPNANFPSGDGTPGGDFSATFTLNLPVPEITAVTPPTANVNSVANLTLSGNNLPTWSGTVSSRSTVSFNGVNDSYHIPSSASFNSANFTIEAWVKEGFQIIKRNGSPFVWEQFFFSVNNGGKPRFWIAQNSTRYPLDCVTDIGHDWTHIAATYDGSTQRIYINGVLDVQNTVNLTVQPWTEYISLYAEPFWDLTHCAGSMAEFRFWNVARTQAQIASTMNTALVGGDPNLTCRYDFSSGAPNLVDTTGNGNTATPLGSPVFGQKSSGPVLVRLSNGIVSATSSGTLESTPTSLNCTVDLAGLPPGKYDVELLQSGVVTATLPLGFTIQIEPVAENQSVVTPPGVAKTITLQATNPNNGTLTWTIVDPPAHGTFSGTAPDLTYIPDGSYTTFDNFTFQVNDGSVDSNIATVTIVPPLQVTALSVTPGSTLAAPPTSITATFSANVDPASVSSSSVKLVRAGPDGVFDTADDVSVTPAGISGSGNQATLDLTGVQLLNDHYRLRLKGSRGGYLSFDGSELVALPDDIVHSSTSTTLECWFKTSSPGGIFGYSTNRYPSGPGSWVPALYIGTDGKLRGQIGNLTANPITTAATVTDGQWHHAALSVQANGNQAFYLDGQLVGTTSGALNHLNMIKNYIGVVATGNWPANVGDPGWLFFNGQIDEFRIWSVARTQAEIQNAMGLVVPGNSPGLKASWRFEEQSGQTVLDDSPNHLNGTLGNDANVGSDDPARIPNGPILDLNGNFLDGEPNANFPSGNGSAGGDFTATFTVNAPPLQVTALSLTPGSTLAAPPASITATFSQNVDPASVAIGSFRLIGRGADGVFDTQDDVVIVPAGLSVNGNVATLDLTGVDVPADTYQLRLNGNSSGGTALSFDSNKMVRIPNFGMSVPTSEVTVEFWQRATSAANSVTFGMNPDDYYNRFNGHFSFNGTIIWDFGNYVTGPARIMYPAPDILNQWQHFALVASTAGNFMRIYRNGVLEASKSGVDGFDSVASDLWIGSDGTQYSFSGQIDEFRIWNIARTQNEIVSTYKRKLTGNEPGLVAYWDFDEGGGQVVNDRSQGGHQGTLGTDINSAADDPVWVYSGAPIISGITDLYGNPLDGEPNANFPSGNGTPGGDFTATFRIDAPPVAFDQSFAIHAGTSQQLQLNGNDADNDPLTFAIASQPAHGTLSGAPPFVTYTPFAGFVGSDSFTFKANDGYRDGSAGTISFIVTNTGPTANGQSVSAHFGIATPITLSGVDADNDALLYTVLSQPEHGALTGSPPNLVYTAEIGYVGSDSFTFNVSDGLALSAPATISITDTNIAPSVVISASPTSVPPNVPVTFNATGSDPDGDALSYAWDFGDGATSTEQNPAHAYAQVGSYTATVTVNDASGASATASVLILVSKAPVVRLTTDEVVGFGGLPLLFDASYSTDPENQIASYDWDFGDGTPHGSGQIISKVYDQPGTYTVTLTITDAAGVSSTLTRVMEVLSGDEVGLFNGFMKYKVSWNRRTVSKDSLTFEASVNVGDDLVRKGTPVALEIVGQRFTGVLDQKLRDYSNVNQKWQVKAQIRHQPFGTVSLKATIKKASLGLSFNQIGVVAGADPHDIVSQDITAHLEIGTHSYEMLLPTDFKFSGDRARAKGDGASE